MKFGQTQGAHNPSIVSSNLTPATIKGDKMSGKNLKRRNAAKAARHDRCWANSQRRKELRKLIQHEAEQRNKKLRKEGLPTPWEQSIQKRLLAHGR